MIKIFKIIPFIMSLSLFGCQYSNVQVNTNNIIQKKSASRINLDNDDSLTKIQERGLLIVGTSADYKPYEFHKLIDGKDEIVGYDIDVAKEIAKDMGVSIRIEDISFQGLLTALNSGNIDIVIAGICPTKERLEAVDFTKTYCKSTDKTYCQKLLIRTEDKEIFNDLKSLAGKRVGVQRCGIQEKIVKEQLSNSNCICISKVPTMIIDLKLNKVDAALLDSDVAKNYANTHEELMISEIVFNENEDEFRKAIAVRKNSHTLIKQINKTLDRLMENGLMDEIIKKYEEIDE